MNFNYQSEFDFVLNFENEVTFPAYNFDGYVHIAGAPYPRVHFSQKNGVLTNCYNDNDKIHVICNNHSMGVGMIVVDYFAHLANTIYPDQMQTICTPIPTQHSLVCGKGDEGTPAEVDAILPYAVVTMYDIAKRDGYTGTREQWEESNSNLPKCVAAAYHQPVIGSNCNWWIWNITNEQYEDSGISAQGSGVEVVQDAGQSKSAVMSQKAVTDSLNGVIDGATQAIATEMDARIVADNLLQPKQDQSLETESDTIVGAINELREGLVQEGQTRMNNDNVLSQDVETRVEKVAAQSGYPFVYGRKSIEDGGTEGKFSMAMNEAAAATVVQRNGKGQIATASPELNNQATPKKYVDDAFGDAATKCRQENTAVNQSLAVIFKGNNRVEDVNAKEYYTTKIYGNPSTGVLYANGFKVGNVDVATTRLRYTYNEGSVTIESLVANADYVFNAQVALLTVTEVVVSTQETKLFFTTATTIPIITFPASIKKIGNWDFDPNAQYIITVNYGTAKAEKAV